MNKIRLDFLIILCVIIAAPVGFTIKYLYKNKQIEDKSKYTIQISLTDSINNLNHYNFKEHYKTISNNINKGEKLAYFSACSVFNRYKDDLIMYNKLFYKDTLLVKQDEEKNNLLNWCLMSYKYMGKEMNPLLLSEYYRTIALNNLYGFKGNIDLEKAETYFKLSNTSVRNIENDRTLDQIDKYRNIYPGFKDEYLLPYIDSALKNRKK